MPNFVKNSELVINSKTTPGVDCESSHTIISYFVSCFMIYAFFPQRVENELIIGSEISTTFHSKFQHEKCEINSDDVLHLKSSWEFVRYWFLRVSFESNPCLSFDDSVCGLLD